MTSKRAVQIRVDDEVLGRVDSVAKMLGMSRSRYCAYMIESLHTPEFNPMSVAQLMLENNAPKE